MQNKKNVIAVAEPSYIIRKGLVYVLSQSSVVSKVVELREMEDLNLQLSMIQPDALIINPMMFGHANRSDIRQQLNIDKELTIIALVYNLIDEKFYKSYDAILRINDSEAKIDNILIEALNKGTKQPDTEELSDREKEILVSVVKGMSNKEIAEYHNISIHTVITHRRNMSRKLKIHSASGLIIYAIINKLVDISEIKYQD